MFSCYGICNALSSCFSAPAAGGCCNQESGTSDDARVECHHRRTSIRLLLLIEITCLPCILTYLTTLSSLLMSHFNTYTLIVHLLARCLVLLITFLSG